MGSVNNLSNLSSSYLQSALSEALQSAGLTTNTTGNSSSSGGVSSISQSSDNGQLSPLAQLMSTLQQLQQSNPTEYKQVTQQVAANLQSAGQTAQADGNSAAANQLNQLATDFTTASQSGQMPDLQNLAQAAGGHHHHHGGSGASSNSSATSSSSSDASTSTSRASSTTSLNPMAIILDTLGQAGITTSNS
ncbi:MAG TPA: hypothetical protein VH325_10720 [Bryobacteraceae bacterium]|jgi:hypothetical protein|nr:hypothetical protein [Bryobacteraceae bacterium]